MKNYQLQLKVVNPTARQAIDHYPLVTVISRNYGKLCSKKLQNRNRQHKLHRVWQTTSSVKFTLHDQLKAKRTHRHKENHETLPATSNNTHTRAPGV